MTSLTWSLFFLLLNGVAFGGKFHHRRTHQYSNRTVIVQLFEWKWLDIADECERFLAPSGYGGVQTSPAAENLVIYLRGGKRPWYERYQVMSYIIDSRSGSEAEFLNMTRRCNDVGVRIYVDVVLNHMTGDHSMNGGTAGSTADFANSNYPTIPYSSEDFHHPICDVRNYDNATEVRNCRLLGLKDLNQTSPYVRKKISEYLNKLINFGVAGFRVDAAKHMSPEDLKQIYSSLNYLNTDFGFVENSKPYIYQEVSIGGVVSTFEYKDIGDVTEFNGSAILYEIFNRMKPLTTLAKWGNSALHMLPSANALAFVDNHDTQRNGGSLCFKDGAKYQAAIAFLLAHPYGQARIISSYEFDAEDEGPPVDSSFMIKSPIIDQFGACDTYWICEHRWNTTTRMVKFRNLVHGTKLRKWWANGKNQIAFSRGHKGFAAFCVNSKPLQQTIQTGLPAGTYCDIRSGHTNVDTCTGKKVSVSNQGFADIYLSGTGDDLYLALHIGPESRLVTM